MKYNHPNCSKYCCNQLKPFPPLTVEAIHIWQVQLSKPQILIDGFWQLLDTHEQSRAQRFVNPKHSANFVVARAVLRCLLAAYVNCEPSTIVFQQNNYGKLALGTSPHTPTPPTLHFNLSHAGDVAMYAFSKKREVGIDVEQIRQEIEITEIATRFFSLQENAALSTVPQALRLQTFFNCWTRKEAFIKAIGKGLSYSLHKFSVDLNPITSTVTDVFNEITKLFLCVNDPELYPNTWSLFNLPIKQPYCAALVVENEIATTQISQYVYEDYL